ncbi:MAG: hypothetical protein ABMA00_18965 [Gemmatimonas sp.]
MRPRLTLLAGLVAAAAVVVAAAGPPSVATTVRSGVGPTLSSIGTLAFGPGGVLYAADPQSATIYAIELGAGSTKGAGGTKDIAGIDQQIASLLGTSAGEIAITDLAVDARTRNSYLAVMRGQGAGAKPVLLRIDGAGKLEIVNTDALKFTSIALPNPADANPTARSNPRMQSVTDMAFVQGKLFVAGLSNEEFSSKLWAVPYPFATTDRGTSVEIFHGNHGRLETRSPVYTFVPYTIDNQPYLIGGYLCTPLVKFPLSSLTPGAKVQGTTIAELGAGNRPIDMVLYKKDGAEYLLMANTSRGVMKIPTMTFGTQPAISAPVPNGTAGVGYETIASMKGIQQLDLLDATHTVVLAKTDAGAINLSSVILP